MTPIKDILLSPAFMREVSILFVGLGALSFMFSLLLFAGSSADPNALSLAVGFLLQAIIYVVLGIMVRRGSVKSSLGGRPTFYAGYFALNVLCDGIRLCNNDSGTWPSNLSDDSLRPQTTSTD